MPVIQLGYEVCVRNKLDKLNTEDYVQSSIYILVA